MQILTTPATRNVELREWIDINAMIRHRIDADQNDIIRVGGSWKAEAETFTQPRKTLGSPQLRS